MFNITRPLNWIFAFTNGIIWRVRDVIPVTINPETFGKTYKSAINFPISFFTHVLTNTRKYKLEVNNIHLVF